MLGELNSEIYLLYMAAKTVMPFMGRPRLPASAARSPLPADSETASELLGGIRNVAQCSCTSLAENPLQRPSSRSSSQASPAPAAEALQWCGSQGVQCLKRWLYLLKHQHPTDHGLGMVDTSTMPAMRVGPRLPREARLFSEHRLERRCHLPGLSTDLPTAIDGLHLQATC